MPIDDVPYRKVSWRVTSVSRSLYLKGVPFVLAMVTLALSPEVSQAQSMPTTGTGGAPGTFTTTGSPGQPEELGIPLGSFRLYPTLELRGGYDTNVFAEPSGQQTGSVYGAIRPTLELNSDWNNHALNFYASGDFAFYPSATSQNYQNFNLGTNGRLDIQNDFNLSAKAAFNHFTQALGSPDTASFGQQPTVVNSLPAEIALYQRFNRFFYRASGRITPLWYTTYGAVPTNILPAASQDRTEFGEDLRTGYEIREGLDVWVQGSLLQRRYAQTVNILNQARDANVWSVVGGATIDMGGISKIEGFFGYTEESYLGQFNTVGAPTFGLAGIWNGYQPLIVRPFVTRSFQGTAFTNYTSYISTNVGVLFDYTVTNDWQLTGGLAYGFAEYQMIPGVGATPRTDNFYRASLGLLYSFQPQFQIGPTYEFLAANGNNFESPNYTRSIFMLRLVMKR